MVPLMVDFLNLCQHKAHGTSLVALVFTGIAGAVVYSLKGSVDITASFLLAMAAILTARAGARFAHALPDWKLKKAFGAFLIAAALLLLMKPYLDSLSSSANGLPAGVMLFCIGAFSGFLSGMMGVGGGTVMVPAMVLLAGFGQHTAQGSSLLAMIPAGSVGAVTHARLGNVQKALLPGLIGGVLAGTALGGTLAHLLPEGLLRVVFASVLVWTGARYLRTPARNSYRREAVSMRTPGKRGTRRIG
ncbi:MAG: sulfite exporter TauE/SafE family protein [Thermodesulfovibrionales bacterium]